MAAWVLRPSLGPPQPLLSVFSHVWVQKGSGHPETTRTLFRYFHVVTLMSYVISIPVFQCSSPVLQSSSPVGPSSPLNADSLLFVKIGLFIVDSGFLLSYQSTMDPFPFPMTVFAPGVTIHTKCFPSSFALVPRQ